MELSSLIFFLYFNLEKILKIHPEKMSYISGNETFYLKD